MTTVPVLELAPGTAFRCPWRREGRQVGEVLYHGTGSTTVKLPHLEDSGYETVTISQGTMVLPVGRDAFNTQVLGNTLKSKSKADNPVEVVWSICDKLKAEFGRELKMLHTKEAAWLKLRTQAMEQAIAAGVNRNTAKTQYYAWRKQNK